MADLESDADLRAEVVKLRADLKALEKAFNEYRAELREQSRDAAIKARRESLRRQG